MAGSPSMPDPPTSTGGIGFGVGTARQMNVTPVHCGPFVNESERKAFEQIKSRLISVSGDGEWLLLTNLAFSATHRLQSDEIDIVAIGPPGVRVIEVKHWTAAWVDRNPGLVEQEADRVTNKARKIGTTLRRRVANLGRVDGAFLVTEEPASKVRRLEGKLVRGVPFHTFRTWRDAVGVDAPGSLSSRQIETLARALAPRSGVAMDGALQRLAGHVRLKLRTPPDERFHRIYEAVHASRQDRVLLHLYDLSASDEPNAETRARREFDALLRLRLHAWAPGIIESFQDVSGYVGELKFFTVADPAAPSLKERACDDSWDTTARLGFARDTVRALEGLHDAGASEDAGGANEPMVHRNLSPRTILVKHDNSPILTGFERTRIPAAVTVASAGASSNEWDHAVAPEVRAQGRGAADRRSDVYSLCASLTVLFSEREGEASRKAVETLSGGMADAPDARSTLQVLEASLSELLGESVPRPPPPPARFWTEDQVVRFRDQDYRIVSRLGSGGVGTTFKVVKIDRATGEDLGAYVAKVVRDKETGRRVLRAYEMAHSHLRHSALSTIFEVAPGWRDNGFVALMTWVEGEPIGEFAGLLPILAEDLQEESGEALALRWLRTACQALDVLHRNGLVHGDVSPRNMIVSGGDLVVTDYDFVGRIGKQIVAPGTILYCSTSYLEGRPAAAADDLYALAASFFQILFEREPFQYDGTQAKERGLCWDGVERGEYPTVAEFLDQATDPVPERRFASAADAVAVLMPRRSGEFGTDEPPGMASSGGGTVRMTVETNAAIERAERHANEVDWLKSLLQSYPGSRWGNRETRGLDTEFAASTYVETNLEQALYRDILERRVRLVILCGNAGDGKTALLQHLAERLGFGDHTSATRILEGRTDDGLTVRMNLDGSASWKGRSADTLLDEFLAPFQSGSPTADIVHLLAINDGRLLEWIEGAEHRRGRETPLTTELYALLDDQASAPGSHIRFISLNQRSLVGSVAADETAIESGFIERLLDNLYGGENASEIWAPCRMCSAQDRCEVLRAARLFGPDVLPDPEPDDRRKRARQRLFEMLQAVHLRGETHITVRELRAALVYILFGIHFCRDYHDGTDTPPPYWDRAFSPESPGRQGEVLRELVRFDPAHEAHPRIDRYLLHGPSFDATVGVPRYPETTLASARRQAYFEWTKEDVESLAREDPHALDLTQGRHFRRFRDLAIDKDGHDELCKKLCEGISRLESLPPQALDRLGVVPLRITPRTPTETAFWVEKRMSDFRLEADLPPAAEGLDRLHRQAFLIYRYRDGREESLRLGADLFHLLLELSDGYQLGDVSTDDTFAHLSIFVQRLVREDDRKVLAWNPMKDDAIYEISANVAEDADAGAPQRMVIRPLRQGDHE